MKHNTNNMRRIHGLKILLSHHPAVRRIKRNNPPALHGNKVWSSGLLLIDYLKHYAIPARSRVLDVGCGWGLAGIYCARAYRAEVTGVDADPHVFPYLNLHAEINHVQVATLAARFQRITRHHLSRCDVLIGSDICFWDEMVKPLRNLMRRAMNCGVKQILLADPGRGTFDTCVQDFVDKDKGEVVSWEIKRPRSTFGRIFRYAA